MVSRKTVALHRHPGCFPPSSEFYANLFVKLNSFLMVVFPVNSIFRSWMGDTWPLVPVQTLFNLCFAKLVYSVNISTKFKCVQSELFDVEHGAVNQVGLSNELMAKTPDFHQQNLLYFLGLIMPVTLWGIPKGIDALVPIENEIFPEKAFCVSGSTCTSEEHQNVIRWWTQIVMGLLLMMWNRTSDHRIRELIVDSTTQLSTQACRDLPEYHGNVISSTVQKGINSIMSAGLITFYFNGKILDAAQARDNPTNARWFNDVGVFKNALPTFYLAISYLNWKGIFPKGKWGWGLHQQSMGQHNAVKYIPIARVKDTMDRIPYSTSLCLLLVTMGWVNVLDRILFTSYDNQSPLVDMMYVNSIVFSVFLMQQFLFWNLVKTPNHQP